jgi:hypothetical protein
VILKGQWIVSAETSTKYYECDLNWDHALCPRDIRRKTTMLAVPLVYEEFDQNGEARIVTLNRNKEKQQ